jgi:tRNA(adenine34) deaminase
MDMDQFNLELSDPMHQFHLMHMEIALEEARAAEQEDEVPVGALIVSAKAGIIAKAHNQRELLKDPTAHAEMIAITQAAQYLQSWRLENCILYVTLEPCPMCAGAILHARIAEVIFGAYDHKWGAAGTIVNLFTDATFNHSTTATHYPTSECADILTRFFKGLRKK